ncbi:hypothetical protein BO86DRAFT_35420 [Aspergillus japonicus CBS 114.51]|uniref:Secreted protein n=1 Tax=Aspergillus japonicus CBS 114.51 TaxID=1448312 RepID=A0A8T8X6P0_ASPJA|nr:hypothetical protein BO86DRAFT_35420 [Aspergillus japonicus CBS 114.51]RAH83837.1 hypothetical protein BO86DRAFT_35420 [Aspergillus japonicus CBS 114.51]
MIETLRLALACWILILWTHRAAGAGYDRQMERIPSGTGQLVFATDGWASAVACRQLPPGCSTFHFVSVCVRQNPSERQKIRGKKKKKKGQ